jgi:DNA-binding PadR family transcriptional regulator
MDILTKIPKEGFLKTTVEKRDDLSTQQRVQLIRRGNEFFNQGNMEMARKVFLTLGYKDGIIRLGDLYYEKGEPLEAFKMYREAEAQEKVDEMVIKMAQVIKKWLK